MAVADKNLGRIADRSAPTLLERICAATDPIVDVVLLIALIGELLAVVAQVIARLFFGYALLWSAEIASLAISVLAFIGGAIAYRRNAHTAIHFLIAALPPHRARMVQITIEYAVVLISLVVGYFSLEMLQNDWGTVTEVLEIRAAWISLPFTISMAMFIVYAINRLTTYPVKQVAAIGGAFVCIFAVVYLTESTWRQFVTSDVALTLMISLFLVLAVIGLPVGFALAIGAALFVYLSNLVPLVAVPQNMASTAHHFVLLSLPFFLLAGLIMERGGISLRFVRFAASLVGHLPGGLLQVVVVSIFLVSGVSGSKAADVVAVGSVMRKMLMRRGYKPEEAAAVLAASAAMAETIPPSVPMLVIGSITSVSIGTLFLAGLLPAVVLALCLMMLIYVQARLLGIRSNPRAPVREILTNALTAILPMCLPLMLIIGIRFGYATPTEVSAFAVIFGLMLSCLVYRELPLANFLRAAVDCATTTGMILFVLAAAGAFAWTLTVAELPQRLAIYLSSMHESRELFLIATIILLIVMGTLLEGLPALLIMAPMLMPTAVKIGIDPAHYAIVMILAMGVGAFLPPIGIGFLISCGVADSSIGKSARAMRPHLITLVLGIVFLAMFPWFSLVIPSIFGPQN